MRKLFVFTVLIFALVFFGCGGSGTGSGKPATTGTKVETIPGTDIETEIETETGGETTASLDQLGYSQSDRAKLH